jgi:YD repeat-containing protein
MRAVRSPTSVLRGALVTLLAALSILPAAVSAQRTSSIPDEKNFYLMDQSGLEIGSGDYVFRKPMLTIGGFSYEVQYVRYLTDNYNVLIHSIPASGRGQESRYVVSDGFKTYGFRRTSPEHISESVDGARLTTVGNELVFQAPDGTHIRFPSQFHSGSVPDFRHATSKTTPDGRRLTFFVKEAVFCLDNLCIGRERVSRRQAVLSNDGFFLKFSYLGNDFRTLAGAQTAVRISSVQGGNMAQVYCDLTQDSCSALGTQWPRATISYETDFVTRFTDSAGTADLVTTNRDFIFINATETVGKAGSGVQITRTNSRLNESFVQDIITVQKQDLQWVYRRVKDCTLEILGGEYSGRPIMVCREPSVDTTLRTTYQDGSIVDRTFDDVGTGSTGLPLLERDELGRERRFTYTSIAAPFRRNVLTRAVLPGGDSYEFSYDTRGNRTTSIHRANAGAGGGVLQSSAAYPATCTSNIACNVPNSVTDALGRVTDYAYDPVHGGLLSETGPAVGGVRPQKRLQYTQRLAWIRNSAGAFVQASQPIWLLASESMCRTSAATGNPSSPCAAGASDEVRTVYDYGPDSGPNNLLLRGIAVTADGQTIRTCYQYDKLGRRIAETKPLGTGATCS